MRQWPVTVWLFTAIVLLWQAAYLALDTHYVSKHPAWTGIWTVVGLGSLAALVGWRQRWAWLLFLLGPILYWASPAWGARFHPFWDLVELAIAGLLLSPSMRRHLSTANRRRRPLRQGRRWIFPLVFSGALTVLMALPERHPVEHTIGARVATWTIIWLLLAAAMRFVAYVVQSRGRLLGRRGGTPPATGPES
jgi:hypothetical protein